MNVLVWLDLPLVVLGLLALLPQLWLAFRRQRSTRPTLIGRVLSSASLLLFYLGLGSLLTAGVDFGVAAWEKAHRAGYGDREFDIELINYAQIPYREAPDFRLPSLDDDRSIGLSDFRGHKPVVLIFGSFG